MGLARSKRGLKTEGNVGFFFRPLSGFILLFYTISFLWLSQYYVSPSATAQGAILPEPTATTAAAQDQRKRGQPAAACSRA